jgi:DNA invertase Pin-like site-specific DNA recombinase
MRIRPGASLMPEFNPEQPHLPTDKPIVQYIRQSSLGQVKNNVQSKIQQDEMLERRLLKYGWTHDLIIKIEADQGISGQKTRFEREGLDRLYKMIESGEAAAIAGFDASRFWRDRTHVWYNDFIQVLKRFHIPVVMWAHVYWCDRLADEEGLRAEFAQAAHELKRIYKMNDAKLQAVEYGLSFGGGAIPVGYILGEEDGRKFFVEYVPHAEKIRYLFKRYQELDGNLARLGRELVATGFCFPAFHSHITQRMALDYDDHVQGYIIKSRAGLVHILTNPAYLGWYVYDGVIVSKEAHAAIVSYDDFMYAFNRLSPYTLDGEENNIKPTINRTFQTTQALLEGILTANGMKAYVNNGRYRVYRSGSALAKSDTPEMNVTIKHLDAAFSDVFVRVLIGIKQAAQKAGEPTAMDALAATIDQLSKEKAAKIGDIDEALANVEQGIKEWELSKRVAMKELYEPGVEEAVRQLKTLHATKAMLLEKVKAATSEQSELARTQSLIDEATTQWETMLFERKQQLVKLVVQSADMTAISPSIIQITIELKEPVKGRLIGYLHRMHASSVSWTDEEIKRISSQYPAADRAEILRALPMRSWHAIREQARINGVVRQTRMNTSQIPERLSYADVEILERLQLRHHEGAPSKGGYTWSIEGEIGLLFWSVHLNQYVQKNIDSEQYIRHNLGTH